MGNPTEIPTTETTSVEVPAVGIDDFPTIVTDTLIWFSDNPAKCMAEDGSTRIPLKGRGLYPKQYSNYEKMGLCAACPRAPYKGNLCIYRRPKHLFVESTPHTGCAGGNGYSEEVLMSCLVRLWKQLGHPPSTEDINKSSAPSATTYSRRYGNLAGAKRAAQRSVEEYLPEWVCPYCRKVLKGEKGWKSHTKVCKKKQIKSNGEEGEVE